MVRQLLLVSAKIYVENLSLMRELCAVKGDIDTIGIFLVDPSFSTPEGRLSFKRKHTPIVNVSEYLPKFTLSSGLKQYFLEEGFDIKNLSCVGTNTSMGDPPKTIRYENPAQFQKWVQARFGLKLKTNMCLFCRGTGVFISYDQCGCVESEHTCGHCHGAKNFTRYVVTG